MFVDTVDIDRKRLGRVVETEEIRRVQLEMLDALADFCDKNGITYYISSGSLLGAVRHKGYIPWDDDIDVNMPRPDVEKLIALSKGRLNDHTVIGSPFGPFHQSTTFPRVCDTRYILNSSSADGESSYYTNLFVDIFPIEGLPTDIEKVKWHYRHAQFLVTMRKLAFFKGVSGEMTFRKLLRYAARPVAKLMGWEFWSRRLQKLAKKYKYDECEYVGVVTSCMHKLEEYIEREGYGEPVLVEFEGKQYKAPHNWDKYLSNLYGDYMQLPPEEKRIPHNFKVYENMDEVLI